MSLLSELRKRNVLKMALLYVVSSWLILQVADVLLPNLGAPDWSFSLVFGLLLLGFPLVLVFSWVYEITPEGIKRESEVSEGQAASSEQSRKTNILIIVMLVLAIAVVIVDRLIPEQVVSGEESISTAPATAGADPEPEPAESAISIAVLPFADMSPEKDQAYLSDGIAEELLNLLAKVPDLRVVSRTSAFAFKDQNLTVAELAGQLGVAHLLEGSVRKSGERVRISAQLIDAREDMQLWSERWDRDLTDVFAIQDEIASSVVGALSVTLLGQAPKAETTDTSAYTIYLQARHLAIEGTPDSMQQAILLYRRALEIDPAFVPAWLGLGSNYSNLASIKAMPLDEAYAEIIAAVDRVNGIDPENADAYALRAFAEDGTAGNYASAMQFYQRAVNLDPMNVVARNGLAVLLRNLGYIDRGIAMQEQLIANDPLNPPLLFNYGLSQVAARDMEGAAATFEQALSIEAGHLLARVWRALTDLFSDDPRSFLEQFETIGRDTGSDLFLHIGQATALPLLGDEAGGAAALAKLEESWGRPYAYIIATIHAYQNRPDKAFEWLQRALEYNGRAALALARVDPMLVPLHGDERWQPMLEAAGLSDAQIQAIPLVE